MVESNWQHESAFPSYRNSTLGNANDSGGVNTQGDVHPRPCRGVSEEEEEEIDWIILGGGNVTKDDDGDTNAKNDESSLAGAAAAAAAGQSSGGNISPSLAAAGFSHSPTSDSGLQGYTRIIKNSALNLAKAAYSATPSTKQAMEMATIITKQSYSIGKECCGWMMKRTSKGLLEWQRTQLLQYLPSEDSRRQQITSMFYNTLPTLEIVSVEAVATHALQAADARAVNSIREQGLYFLGCDTNDHHEDARAFVIDKYLPLVRKDRERGNYQQLSTVYQVAEKACDALPFCRQSSTGLYQMLVVNLLAAPEEHTADQHGPAGWYPMPSPAAAGGGGGVTGRGERERPSSSRIEILRICDNDRILPRYLITFRNPPLRSSGGKE